MRAVVTSDLHYRPALRPRYAELVRRIADLQPDCLIVAGDVGHPLRLFRRGLQLFAGVPCRKFFVPGNHDLYCGEHDSRTLWESVLPEAAQQAGFECLEERAVCIGSVGLCGTMGWYDYSTRAPHLELPLDAYPALKAAVNHDADYVDWPWSDRAMARFLTRRFGRRLDALDADPAVAQVIVVTHMPIFDAVVPTYPQSDFWSVQRAYMGNLALGHAVRASAKVTHVVSGHIHRGGAWQIAGAGGTIDCRVVGVSADLPGIVMLDLPG